MIRASAGNNVMCFPCSFTLKGKQSPIGRSFAGSNRDKRLAQFHLSVDFLIVPSSQFNGMPIINQRMLTTLPVVSLRTFTQTLGVIHANE